MKFDDSVAAVTLAAVPVGAAHSKTARQIASVIDLWTFRSIRDRLRRLEVAGVIKRIDRPHPGSGVICLFYKDEP